jgi:glycogen debranching enzyme
MTPEDAKEGIWVDDQYYILATSARAATGSAVLKYGDTFSVFDSYGDIVASRADEFGLYHDGTRHLSSLTLRLGIERPLLLSSRTSADNGLFGADLTNPDVLDHGAVVVPRDLIHIFRARFLSQGQTFERIRLVNYSNTRVSLSLVFTFASDFADIFEVRGTRRVRRGVALPAHVSGNAVELAYKGLDDVVRRTRLSWSPAPTKLGESSARYDLAIDSHEALTLGLIVQCSAGELSDTSVDFDRGFADVEARRLEKSSAYAVVSTANEQFNQWVTRSVADLQMMTSDTVHGPYPYAGVPWFSTAFGRDGIITALEVLWMNPSLAAGVLRYLAATQADAMIPEQDAEPGKILHETRGGEMAALHEVPFGRYYGSVDATPLFVVLAGEYYRRTADLDLIKLLWPNIERALGWMERYGDVDGDGFLEYQRRTANGLVQQGWKDSQDSVFHADGTLAQPPIALCEVQGYAYAALRCATTLAAALGQTDRAVALSARADTLRDRFEKAFWWEAHGTYALALDGAKQPCFVRASNPGHCLYSGIVAPDRARKVAAVLMDEEMFSGWGIRTLGRCSARYNPMSYHNGSLWPHDNAIAAAGCAKYGLTDAVLAIMTGMFEASLFVDLQRMPELFCGFRRRPGEGPTLYPVACAPQSWAAGSVFLLLQACLGLSIDALDRRVTISHARLPEFLDQITIRGLRVRDASVDLRFDRHAFDDGVTVLSRTGSVQVIVIK